MRLAPITAATALLGVPRTPKAEPAQERRRCCPRLLPTALRAGENNICALLKDTATLDFQQN